MTEQRHSCTGHAHQCPVKHSYPAGVICWCRYAVEYQPRRQNNEIMNAPFSVLFKNLLFKNCSTLRNCRMKVEEGARSGLPVLTSPYGHCGYKTTLNEEKVSLIVQELCESR